MAALTLPNQFVIFLVGLVIVFFLARSIYSRLTHNKEYKKDSYGAHLFASKKLTKKDIRESTAATYTSFGTVFFWFIVLGGLYSWLLLLIPVFLYLGNFLFTKSIKHYGIQIGKFSTIGNYIRSKSGYRPMHSAVDIIIFVFLFATLLVEIVIGSAILASILPGIFGGQLFFVVLLSILVLLYISIGGFRMVVMSDRTQLYMTFIGAIALLIFSLAYLKAPVNGGNLLYIPAIPLPALIAFLVSVISVQIFGPICQLQNWQRISGSNNQEDALIAHRQGALLGAGLWALMILSALILFSKLAGTVSFTTIFSVMNTGGVFTSYILYPLVFISFIAAMISTADSATAALYLFFYNKAKIREKRTGKKFRPTFFHNLLIGGGLFIVILLIYYLNQTNLQNFAISTIYFLFNQLIILFPLLLFFMVRGRVIKSKKSERILNKRVKNINRNLTLAIFLGWTTVLLMTIIGHSTGSLNWIMFASAAGVAITFLVSIPSWTRLYIAKR